MQVLPCVAAAAHALQPFPVQQVGAGEVGAEPGEAQPGDRLAIKTLGVLTFVQQRVRTGLDPERPVGAAGPGQPRTGG